MEENIPRFCFYIFSFSGLQKVEITGIRWNGVPRSTIQGSLLEVLGVEQWLGLISGLAWFLFKKMDLNHMKIV